MSHAQQPIVIVRKSKHHAAHHGGAWKVAYADFVTALMAFFLVMWLVGQSKEVKAAVGGYFRDPGVFDSERGQGVLPGSLSLEHKASPKVAEPTSEEAERRRLETAAAHIRERLDAVPAFKKLRSQIEFTVTPEGLRIDLIEKDESTFFASGSAVLRGETEHILGIIARELGALDDQLVIEGHTDSRAYTTSERYSNWELSTDRANAARRVMEASGLRGPQIGSVLGLADRQLRVPDRPLDPRNRRVSILVKNPLFKPDSGAPAPPAQAIMGERTN